MKRFQVALFDFTNKGGIYMKKLLLLLIAVVLFAIPVVGNCESNEGQSKIIMVKTEFIELNNLGDSISEKVVAKPSVSVFNNQEAKIFMGDRLPVDVQNNEFKDIGLGIAITPTISDDCITLKVNWSSSRVESYSDGKASISEIGSKANLSCKNGETVILGSPTKDKTNSIMLVKITPTIIN